MRLCILLVAGLMCAGAVVSSTPAHAEVYKCGTFGNYHDGYTEPADSSYPQYEGVYARLIVQYGAVCDTKSGQNNYTSAYVMITDDDLGWSQVGFVRWYNHVTVDFAQYEDANLFGQGSVPTKYGTTSVSTGTARDYRETWNTSTGLEGSYVNGNRFYTTGFNPYAQWDPHPWSAQFDGEAAYLASDIPGNAQNTTQFNNIQGQSASTDNNVQIPCGDLKKHNDGANTRTDGESWYDQETSCPDFQIFTDTSGLQLVRDQ